MGFGYEDGCLVIYGEIGRLMMVGLNWGMGYMDLWANVLLQPLILADYTLMLEAQCP